MTRLTTTLMALSIMLMLPNSQALAVDASVRMACAGDYFRFCAYTVPGTASCKACFRQVGRRLSTQCRAAIHKSPEFRKDYARVARRYTRRHR